MPPLHPSEWRRLPGPCPLPYSLSHTHPPAPTPQERLVNAVHVQLNAPVCGQSWVRGGGGQAINFIKLGRWGSEAAALRYARDRPGGPLAHSLHPAQAGARQVVYSCTLFVAAYSRAPRRTTGLRRWLSRVRPTPVRPGERGAQRGRAPRAPASGQWGPSAPRIEATMLW